MLVRNKTPYRFCEPLLFLAVSWLPAVPLTAQTTGTQLTASTQNKAASTELIESGKTLFLAAMGFCMAGMPPGRETGSSLVDSELVKRDKAETEVAALTRNGRPEKGMPKFDLAGTAMDGVVAFICNQQAGSNTNDRGRGVLPADLQTGNAAMRRKYFEGQGGCITCRSPAGDLAHVGTRLIGLKLQQRMR